MPRVLGREAEFNPSPFGEYGRLTYDEIEDGLLCHECGGWYRQLATHVRLAHKLSAEDYREKHGLNRNTKLLTPKLRERLRETTLPHVLAKLARGDLQPLDRYPEKRPEVSRLAAEVMHQGLRPEGLRNRRESWDDERRAQMREFLRERKEAGITKPTPFQIREGIRRTGGQARCERCGILYQRENKRIRYCPNCRLEARREVGRAYDRRVKADPDRPRRERTGDAREIQCRRCGRECPAPPTGHHAVYCPGCRPLMMREYQRDFRRRLREKRERERQGLSEPTREILCERCRQAFAPPAKSSRLCQQCQREEMRERKRDYYLQRKAARGPGTGREGREAGL